MTVRNRDDLDQEIRELFDAPPGSVEKVVARAVAHSASSGVARRRSIAAAVLALTIAAVALWLRLPWPRYVAADGQAQVFSIGDLTVLIDEDGTSWVVGPGPASGDDDHFDLIIVEEQEP